MLIHLQIRDFVIVAGLDLDLAPGMSAVTGETGAGKSIMVDALGLLLGDRADAGVVRQGAEQAEISALFDLAQLPAAQDWLAERELGADGECHLRRIINRQGRSRAYINGAVQPLQALKELGERLVDIHGQHEHQSLLKREAQRRLLDDWAGNQSLAAEVEQRFRDWERRRQGLEALRQAGDERNARLDLLRYQVRELEALALGDHELAELAEEHPRLANAGRLLEVSQQALGWLYEDEPLSAHRLLSQSAQHLAELAPLDGRLGPMVELLNTALIQVREASDELRHYGDGIDLDPQRLAWVEQRLADIDTLARKHRLPPEQLPALLGRLQAELNELDNSEFRQEELARQVEQALMAYRQIADRLSARRAAAAAELGSRVSAAMGGLGMPGGRFEVALEAQPRPSARGLETVEFLVSANPGQPLAPLSKVASGGELSRISLAIQVIAAHGADIPTLIFDEVDTGIGGGVAEVVGRQLRALGESRQVLCVTHLPQVAAQAHHHLQVSKHSDGQATRAQVTVLDDSARVEEIARMLGGVELTDKTRLHAQEMIERAQASGQGS